MTEQKTAFTIDADYVEQVLKTPWFGKYDELVWAARKPPLDANVETWNDFWTEDGKRPESPMDIKTECLKQLRRIAEEYPEEYDELKNGEQGQYTHGFNSGCLAMIRWFITAFDNESFIDDEGNENCFGGIENANKEFPFLDT